LTKTRSTLGCLLGTAAGDSIGLPREVLSRHRAESLFGDPPLRQSLVFGKGLCSDDTEHTVLTLLAIRRADGDLQHFRRLLAGSLKWWMLRLPAGTGLATLRACIKLWIPVINRSSGVHSAGAGPAMRSAILGVTIPSHKAMTDHVIASTRLTHTDPRAITGALCVALAARLASAPDQDLNQPVSIINTVTEQLATHLNPELDAHLRLAADMLAANASPTEFAAAINQHDGVTGYINHVVPAALYCWLRTPNDFRCIIESAVALGGDSDTVAAIAGAIAGARLGPESIPTDWLNDLAEWPCDAAWMTRLAEDRSPPSLPWARILFRNLLFFLIVLAHAFWRLAPPYR